MPNPSARAREKPESTQPPVAPPPIVAPIFNLPAADKLNQNDTPNSVIAKARIIRLNGQVGQEMANAAINDLLYFEAMEPGKPITMLINSPGGYVSHGWAIIDMMNMISSPVHTVAIGRVASMGATILLAGEKGHRSATPNASIMIHEPSNSGISGQADDVEIGSDELKHTKARMLAFYAMTSGTSASVLKTKMGRDYTMYPVEALELGIIDKIAGFPACKADFNAAAQKSNEAHLANNKRRSEPEPA